MQSEPWADIKSAFGWKIVKIPDSILVYNRSVPSLGKLSYIPGISGLTVSDVEKFTNNIKVDCPKSFAARIEPYQPYDEKLVTDLLHAGWKKTKRHVQYRHTILIDLKPTEEEILANFKSRARWEIKQAMSFGVTARESETSDENLEKMFEILRETSERNSFYIRDKKFTMMYWKKFAKKGMLKLFFAKHEGDILAGAVIISNDGYAWYKEGGSLKQKSRLLGPRLLLWEVMKTLKSSGINTFDLGGIPDPAHHAASSLSGVYVFKSAFSRETVELMPTMELPLSKRYALWPKIEPQWLRAYNLFAKNLWY